MHGVIFCICCPPEISRLQLNHVSKPKQGLNRELTNMTVTTTCKIPLRIVNRRFESDRRLSTCRGLSCNSCVVSEREKEKDGNRGVWDYGFVTTNFDRGNGLDSSSASGPVDGHSVAGCFVDPGLRKGRS